MSVNTKHTGSSLFSIGFDIGKDVFHKAEAMQRWKTVLLMTPKGTFYSPVFALA